MEGLLSEFCPFGGVSGILQFSSVQETLQADQVEEEKSICLKLRNTATFQETAI